MRKNDIITLTIHSYQQDGFGVGRSEEGLVVFVPNTAVGETWEVRIVKVLSKLAYGKAERLITASPDRIENDCPSFPACGGCAFRHISYESELAYKKSVVENALLRIGGIAPGPFPIYGAPTTYAYRNKAVYPLGIQKGDVVYGFYRTGSHKLVPATVCKIQPEDAGKAAEAVCEYMKEAGLAPYNEETRTGHIRYVMVRVAEMTGEVLVCLITACKSLPAKEKLAERLKMAVPGLASLYQSVNADPGNRILGKELKLLWGKPRITDRLDGLSLSFGPESFYQVNRAQCEVLYSKVLEFAGQGADIQNLNILDLYCGIGSITLYLARHCKKAVGVEVVAGAVEDAKENARQNGLDNAEFFCADAQDTPAILEKIGFTPDLVVVDPPRKGLGEGLCRFLGELAVPRMVYVSCDPATLARDLKQLTQDGYRVDNLAAVDLFPRTVHVECVVLMQNVKNK